MELPARLHDRHVERLAVIGDQQRRPAEALGDADRRRVPLRRDFDIASFGVNAIYQAKAGVPVSSGARDQMLSSSQILSSTPCW